MEFFDYVWESFLAEVDNEKGDYLRFADKGAIHQIQSVIRTHRIVLDDGSIRAAGDFQHLFEHVYYKGAEGNLLLRFGFNFGGRDEGVLEVKLGPNLVTVDGISFEILWTDEDFSADTASYDNDNISFAFYHSYLRALTSVKYGKYVAEKWAQCFSAALGKNLLYFGLANLAADFKSFETTLQKSWDHISANLIHDQDIEEGFDMPWF